ncbi:MAG: cbb3-type cytochrome c oxidase subunit I [Magnetococcales bacterium]|nr:cbb3-type cytochrome c oxidase subunit I [Magnetococcales bacterium]
MNQNDFSLTLPTDSGRSLVAGWLMLALASLVGAGLVVILIVLARTPVIHDFIPWVGSFRTALVIHVDLSVLVWFLSFAGVFAALGLSEKMARVGKTSLQIAWAGAIIITLSPFLGEDLPYMNNYVPVLDNGAFFLGLGLFCGGFLVMAVHGLVNSRPYPGSGSGEGALRFGVVTALLIALMAAGSFWWTHANMPTGLERDEYWFELLFWGSGHILQFTHGQLMLVAWLWLAWTSGAVMRGLTPRVAMILLVIGALPALLGPVIHASFDVDSPDHREAFTWQMQFGGGMAALPLGLALLWSSFTTGSAEEQKKPERAALLLSIFLFGVGGLIGFLISGVDVTIPAHYHGSIVSITLAFMGLTYHLLPRLGFERPGEKWATRQLILYGVGSSLHIFGLAWSGGHGVQRKTAGAAQGLVTLQEKIPMWIMGLGGILAVVGGLLFLFLAFRALNRRLEVAKAG